MSELDEVKRLVEQARESVDTAKVAGEAAQQVAGNKMDALTRLGLDGVAQAVSSAADTVASAVGQLGVALGSADEAVSGLADVTDGTRMSVTVAALEAAGEKLGNAGTEVAGAGANADEALSTAQHTEVEPVEVAVTQAASAIGEAVSSIETARGKAEAHRQRVQQTAETLSGGAGSGIVAHTGDQLQPPQGGPDATDHFRTENKSTDDEDKSMDRKNKFGRAALRNTSNLQKQSKETTDALIGQVGAREPIETVGVPPEHGHPVISESPTGAPAGDVVTNAVLYTVFAIEGLSRLGKNRRKKRK